MGIKGVRKVYGFSFYEIDLIELQGATVGIDIHSWLYKACRPMAKRIIKGGGVPAKVFKDIIYKVQTLQRLGIIPILIFDGKGVPIKDKFYKERQRHRDDSLKRASEKEAKGDQAAADKAYMSGFSVGRDIPHQLMERLNEAKLEFKVALFEADGQLAYMAESGQIGAVITVDHDLILYGCQRIIYDLNFCTGRGIEYRRDRMESLLVETKFTWSMFVEASILSGCDYLESISADVTLEVALNLIHVHEDYEKVIAWWEKEGVKLPKKYRESFEMALCTYRHHIVYDLKREEVVNLTPVPNEKQMEFLGEKISNEIAKGIVNGILHPETELPYTAIDQTWDKKKPVDNKGKRKLDCYTDGDKKMPEKKKPVDYKPRYDGNYKFRVPSMGVHTALREDDDEE